MTTWAIYGIQKCPEWYIFIKWTQLYPWISPKCYSSTVWLLLSKSWSINQPRNWFVIQQLFIWGQKMGYKTGPSISHSGSTPNQGYRVNFHVLMFSKRWQTDNTIPFNMFFSILKWCPHLKLRRNQTFHDILGYIRDIKVSRRVYFNDSARRNNGCGSGIVPMHTRQVQNHNAIDHRAIFQFGHFSILNFAKSIIFWNT